MSAGALQVWTVWLALQDEPDKLAAGLLQCATLLLSAYGSVVFGRASASDAAGEMIRPHARAALRRILNLYRALHGHRDDISKWYDLLEGSAESGADDDRRVRLVDVQFAFQALRSQVSAQLATADDAFEDWRDLAPEEVDNITTRYEGAADA